MTAKEKKNWILEHFSKSSGKHITEMLLRYKSDFLGSDKNEKPDILQVTDQIFGI